MTLASFETSYTSQNNALILSHGQIWYDSVTGNIDYYTNQTGTGQVGDSFVVQIDDGHLGTALQNININPDPSLTPIVLDLGNGGKISLTSAQDSGIQLGTLLGNADPRSVGWVAPNADEGILFYDPTHSGQLTNINQIAFVSYMLNAKTDLQGLAFFDSNHDGVLNAQDAAFKDFSVWVDANGNGIVDPGELKSLTQLGITAINLTSDGQSSEIAGNPISGMTTFTTTDGKSHVAADVGFAFGATHSTAPVVSGATPAPVAVSAGDVLSNVGQVDLSKLGTPPVTPAANDAVAHPVELPPLATVNIAAGAFTGHHAHDGAMSPEGHTIEDMINQVHHHNHHG
jgi:hypothetical protein